MRRPLCDKPIRHAPRSHHHHQHHRAATARGSWWVPSHTHNSGGSSARTLVALLSAPSEARLFATHLRQRLLDDLGGVYDGHAVRIRDIDDWDTWDDETADLDYAEVTDLLK